MRPRRRWENPDKTKCRRRAPSSKEHDALVKTILDYCERILKIPATMTDAATVRMPSGRIVQKVQTGWPDITIVMPPMGRAVFVEVKIGKSPMRAEQREQRDAITRAGGVVIVARSLDDFACRYPKSPNIERVKEDTESCASCASWSGHHQWPGSHVDAVCVRDSRPVDGESWCKCWKKRDRLTSITPEALDAADAEAVRMSESDGTYRCPPDPGDFSGR